VTTGKPWDRSAPADDDVEDEDVYDDVYDEYEERPRITFSLEEALHLAGSILVLSFAFSVALACQQGDKGFPCSFFTGDVSFAKVFSILPWSILIVVTGFMLHELAHKIAAQSMYMFAEFRASMPGLGLALLVSSFTGIVIAAPGAVQIYGEHITKRQNGIISIVGPAVNLAIGFACVPLLGSGIDVGGIENFFVVVAFINAFLAAFNMLPVNPLDGSKIWKWNKAIYLGTVLLVVLLFVLTLDIDLGALTGGTSGPGGFK